MSPEASQIRRKPAGSPLFTDQCRTRRGVTSTDNRVFFNHPVRLAWKVSRITESTVDIHVPPPLPLTCASAVVIHQRLSGPDTVRQRLLLGRNARIMNSDAINASAFRCLSLCLTRLCAYHYRPQWHSVANAHLRQFACSTIALNNPVVCRTPSSHPARDDAPLMHHRRCERQSRLAINRSA